MSKANYSEELELIARAESSIDAAVKWLASKSDPTLHLPIEDLRIAARFIELARKMLEEQ